MIIVRLTGGLGNQMFQYAFGRRLAELHSTELKLDVGFYSNAKLNVPIRTYDLDIFKIVENIATDVEIDRFAKRFKNELVDRIVNRILGPKGSHVREPHFHFSQTVFDSPNNVYISGYWQSVKYFADIEQLIRKDFAFRDEPSENAKLMLKKIQLTNSVSVHVRRGDFVTNPLNGLHGVEYFAKAEQIIADRVVDPTFFIFSDDIEWCKANLKFNAPVEFASDDFGERKFRDDLRLMSACQHLIIANSSFSWWAAWLNANQDKVVVAPKTWATDPSIDKSEMYLPGWIRA